MVAIISSGSPVSCPKVVSFETDFIPSRSVTSLPSTPRAASCSPTAERPKRPRRPWMLYAARSPMVCIPSTCSSFSVLNPIPGILRTGSGARNPGTSAGSTTVRPSGFLKSEAIFATSFVGASPSEQVIPHRARISRFSSSASSRASEKLPGRAQVQKCLIDAHLLEPEPR